MKLCVIPARGGSKRIPRKNVRDFCGRPMIAWSIQAARDSGSFDRIVVSTDDDEIASLAVDCGAEVPFRRPAELADDHTATIDVVRHATQWLNGHGTRPEKVCCLYPTAPLVDPADIASAEARLEEDSVQFVCAVTSFAYPVQRALRVSGKGSLEMLKPELFYTRSQDLEEVWHDAGQFYWGWPQSWLGADSVFGQQTVPAFIPRYRVQDIDSPEDWQYAELIFRGLVAGG